jgi:hypothetical protein
MTFLVTETIQQAYMVDADDSQASIKAFREGKAVILPQRTESVMAVPRPQSPAAGPTPPVPLSEVIKSAPKPPGRN